jgi:acyl carrier protein
MSVTDGRVSFDAAIETIRRAIVQVKDGEVSPESISAETRLFYEEGVEGVTLDIDSLDALDVITLVERELQVHLPDEIEFDALKTVGDIAKLLTTMA